MPQPAAVAVVLISVDQLGDFRIEIRLHFRGCRQPFVNNQNNTITVFVYGIIWNFINSRINK